MRSFFSKLGGTTSKSAEGSRSTETELPALLAKAAELLKNLRRATDEDFPLLNEATRHVQLLEGSVASLPEGDSKTIWRTQVAELQKELKTSTERMLSNSRPAPAEDTGVSLFAGMNLAVGNSNPAGFSATSVQTQSTQLGDSPDSDAMFSGLAVGPLSASSKNTSEDVPDEKGGAEAVDSSAQGVGSGPLPEDLFSGLEDLSATVGTPATLVQSGSASPMLPEGLSPQRQPPQPSPAALASSPALLRQGSDVSSSSSSVVSSLAPVRALSPGGVRRKRITRRVGYARDAADDEDDVTPPRSSHAPSERKGSHVAPAPVGTEERQPDMRTTVFTHEPAAPTFDLLDSLSVPSPRLAANDQLGAGLAQVVSEQPLRGGFDILVPRGDSNQQAGNAAMDNIPLKPYNPTATAPPDPQDTKELSFEDNLAAATGTGQGDEAALELGLRQAAATTLAARQRRRSLLADIALCTRDLDETTAAEAAAVEAEDFEQAASLSAKADAAKSRLASLDKALRAADVACTQAVTARLELAAQQAEQRSRSAADLRRLQEQREEKAAQEAAKLAEAQAAEQKAAAGSAEHVEELRARIEARQRWLEGEEAALAAKITEATAPAAAERNRHLSAAAALRQEVEALRASLAEKEAELAGVEGDLAGSEERVRSLAAKYDRAEALLARDREALGEQQQELADVRAAAAAEAERAAAAAAGSAWRQAELIAEAEAARAAAEEMLSAADAIRKQVGAEQRILRLHKSLGAAEASAEAFLQGVEREAERARLAARALAGQRAGFSAEARAAEEAALAARQRVPELEAEKRAAAAARDFKEAARLSAESKARAAEAEAASARATELRGRAAGLESDEAALAGDAARLQGELLAAKRVLALAKWRRLKAAEMDARMQIDAAVSAEKFEEADALQAEHDAAAADASAITAAHGFADSDLGEALLSLSASPDSPPLAHLGTTAAESPQPSPVHQETQGNGHENGPSKAGMGVSGGGPNSVQFADSRGADIVDAAEANQQQGTLMASIEGTPVAAGHRISLGAHSASHVATDGSESVCSVSLASDGNLSSDADPHVPHTLARSARAATGGGPALQQVPRSHAAAAAQLLAAQQLEASLERQLSEGDSASGYMADSDSVRERLAPHGSHSSIDSIVTGAAGAAGLIRHPSGRLPTQATLARAARASEPTVHTLDDDGKTQEGGSGYPVPALDLEQILEGKETATSPGSCGKGSDAGTFESMHSERQGMQGFEPGVLSMAEAAQMHHIDNAGSTAGTMGGDSTHWGGSDAGAGDALGSARSLTGAGMHADVGSDADEDSADSHDDASVHGMRSSLRTPDSQGKSGPNQNGAHRVQEARSDEAVARTHGSSSAHSSPSVSSPPPSKQTDPAVVDVPLTAQGTDASALLAGGDMFAGLVLNG